MAGRTRLPKPQHELLQPLRIRSRRRVDVCDHWRADPDRARIPSYGYCPPSGWRPPARACPASHPLRHGGMCLENRRWEDSPGCNHPSEHNRACHFAWKGSPSYRSELRRLALDHPLPRPERPHFFCVGELNRYFEDKKGRELALCPFCFERIPSQNTQLFSNLVSDIIGHSTCISLFFTRYLTIVQDLWRCYA